MRFCKRLLLIAGYQLSVFILLLLILRSGIVPASLSESTLTHWDALHYTANAIADMRGMNRDFFPLFPYTWHLLQASATSIALLNWSVFSIGMALLATAFEARRSELLLLLSVPSLMFMYLPYTEAFFFLFAVLLILGLKEKNLLLTTLGILLCGIVRPTAVVFAPALLATFYFCEKEKSKALLKALALAALTCAVFFWCSIFSLCKRQLACLLSTNKRPDGAIAFGVLHCRSPLGRLENRDVRRHRIVISGFQLQYYDLKLFFCFAKNRALAPSCSSPCFTSAAWPLSCCSIEAAVYSRLTALFLQDHFYRWH